MYKKCKVVMLPTNEKALIYQSKLSKILGIKRDKKIINSRVIAQHLYILSDNEIKEGDWYYSYLLNSRYIAPKGFTKSKLTNPKSEYKIIASTDPSLNKWIKLNPGELLQSLPSIPQSFIEEYVSEYNKENKIEEVMVKYQPRRDKECIIITPDMNIELLLVTLPNLTN